MAKQVKFSCGHTDSVQLSGPYAERERKIAWMESEGLCPACYKAKKDAERAQANADAAKRNGADGLPNLIGSDKQIVWAESIRREALDAAAQVRTLPANWREMFTKERHRRIAEAYHKAYTEAMAKLTTEASAKWWIDNRGQAKYLLRDAVDIALAANK